MLLGPPASGKGTIARILKEKYNIPHISTGDIIKAEIKDGTDFGRRVVEITSKGKLIPDTEEYVGYLFALLEVRLLKEDCRNGFILDGMPRTLLQARLLHTMLRRLGKKVDYVVELKVGTEILVERVSYRWTCTGCAKPYHLRDRPPKLSGICDDCGAELGKRKDDREDVLRDRVEQYEAELPGIHQFYKVSGVLIEIDGGHGSDAVAQELFSMLPAECENSS